MRENEILEAVSKWLSSLFPNKTVLAEDVEVKVYDIEDKYSIGYTMTYYVKVECKEEMTECYKNLGQCITYCVENGYIPTYLAVPHNYANIERLERVVNSVKLPIGLITVNQNGEVKIAIKPHIP